MTTCKDMAMTNEDDQRLKMLSRYAAFRLTRRSQKHDQDEDDAGLEPGSLTTVAVVIVLLAIGIGMMLMLAGRTH